MNTLSWLIYAADVLGKFAPAAFILTLICFFISLLVVGAAVSDTDNTDRELLKVSKKFIFGFFLFGFITIVSPSKETIYMIAASEVGEQVIKTPEAREVFEALRLRIMDELKVVAK